MGDMSYYYGDTNTTWTDGNENVWIHINTKNDFWYSIEKKKKNKEFISENEFKM